VMICTKRGPLGACQKTEVRTRENDNDKASKVFKDPAPALKQKYESALSKQNSDDDSNELIRRLRQQTIENKEINDREVRQKTLEKNLVRKSYLFNYFLVISILSHNNL